MNNETKIQLNGLAKGVMKMESKDMSMNTKSENTNQSNKIDPNLLNSGGRKEQILIKRSEEAKEVADKAVSDKIINDIKSNIDSKYNRDFIVSKALSPTKLKNIKKYANTLLENAGLEQDILNDYIDNYKERYNTKYEQAISKRISVNNDTNSGQTISRRISIDNNQAAQQSPFTNHDPNKPNKSLLLQFVQTTIPLYNNQNYGFAPNFMGGNAAFGGGPSTEEVLNNLVNSDQKISEILFENIKNVKFSKESISISKDINKNVNLIISFKSFNKDLWEAAPFGIMHYISIPLVIAGKISDTTMYDKDISANKNIKNEWVVYLLEKLDELFDVKIKLV